MASFSYLLISMCGEVGCEYFRGKGTVQYSLICCKVILAKAEGPFIVR